MHERCLYRFPIKRVTFIRAFIRDREQLFDKCSLNQHSMCNPTHMRQKCI